MLRSCSRKFLIKARNFLGNDHPSAQNVLITRCGGHGFVSKLFDGFTELLWLKRWRCPVCHCIITMRPKSHFPRFQASKKDIQDALEHRLTHGKWPPDLSPPRMRYWLSSLKTPGPSPSSTAHEVRVNDCIRASY